MLVISMVTVTLTLVVGGHPSPLAHAEEGQVSAGSGTWPLSPRPPVVSGFDPPDAPWASGHRGVDLAGRIGQPVLAVLPGVVDFAGAIGGKRVLVIDHGDTRTTYEPVAAVVEVGADVRAGAVVGRLVAAGSHCPPGACLHLGWIRNADDAYLDPLALLGVRPVRLWPWGGAPYARQTPSGPDTPGPHLPGRRTPGLLMPLAALIDVAWPSAWW